MKHFAQSVSLCPCGRTLTFAETKLRKSLPIYMPWKGRLGYFVFEGRLGVWPIIYNPVCKIQWNPDFSNFQKKQTTKLSWFKNSRAGDIGELKIQWNKPKRNDVWFELSGGPRNRDSEKLGLRMHCKINSLIFPALVLDTISFFLQETLKINLSWTATQDALLSPIPWTTSATPTCITSEYEQQRSASLRASPPRWTSRSYSKTSTITRQNFHSNDIGTGKFRGTVLKLECNVWLVKDLFWPQRHPWNEVILGQPYCKGDYAKIWRLGAETVIFLQPFAVLFIWTRLFPNARRESIETKKTIILTNIEKQREPQESTAQ